MHAIKMAVIVANYSFIVSAKSIIVLGLFTVLGACSNKKEFQITIEANRTNYDTLFIQELITGRTIAKVPLDKLNRNYSFNIDEATLGSLSVIGTATTYLTIIRPGVKKTILIDSASFRTKQSTPDSLVNYLWESTNRVIAHYSNVIFAQDDSEKVKFIFDSLVQERHALMNNFKSQMTTDEFGILDYQNRARAYSFLMYYGRIIKRYSPDS